MCNQPNVRRRKGLQCYQLLVRGLCKISWVDSGEISTKIGSKLFSFNHINQRREDSFGFPDSKLFAVALIEQKAYPDGLIAVRVSSRARNITTVQSYAPSNVTDSVAKNAFYSSLSNISYRYHQRCQVILVGDMSTQFGQCNLDIEEAWLGELSLNMDIY